MPSKVHTPLFPHVVGNNVSTGWFIVYSQPPKKKVVVCFENEMDLFCWRICFQFEPFEFYKHTILS